ncbi:MAG: hypothetical protein ACRC28_18350, partial [Clostridium sp.]|uniref:hypothetical protein n=1 Tax=Clostridium sp. TaxID=1506 RepID=UPI003F33EFA8
MGLFGNSKQKKSTNENNISNSSNDLVLNSKLLDEKINLCEKISLSSLEYELVNILLDNKDEVSKVLWNIYLPIPKENSIVYKHIDCVLIRNDKIFIFCYEDFKNCIGFKEVNTELWEFEYFTELKLQKNLISKANETAYFLSRFLNLDKKIELFIPVIILVGANSSKNIFSTDSRHIYLRESHTRFLTERVVSLLESKDKGILSD